MLEREASTTYTFVVVGCALSCPCHPKILAGGDGFGGRQCRDEDENHAVGLARLSAKCEILTPPYILRGM